jgi:hypothetical protein
VSPVRRYLLSVHEPVERTGSGARPGGFRVIGAADPGVALALAAQGSKACRGTVEVRPFRTGKPVRVLRKP